MDRASGDGVGVRLSLFWKLLLPFAILLLVVGAFGVFLISRDLQIRAQAALDQDLQSVSLEARALFADRELYLLESATLAGNLEGMASATSRDDGEAITRLLRSVLALKSDLTLLALIDPEGRTVAEPGLERPTPRTWVGVRVVGQALSASEATRSGDVLDVGGRQALIVSSPVCGALEGCAPVGAVVVGLDLQSVVDDIASGLLSGGSVSVLDPSDLVLATAQAMAPAALGGEGVMQTVRAPVTIQGRNVATLAVSLPEEAAFAPVRRAALGLVAVLFVALGGIVLMGALLARAILRQVDLLVETNRRLGAGDLTARADVVSRDEIGELAQGLNQMATQLQGSYETLESRVEQRTAEIQRLLEQRTHFFASLSHELRTPLAVVLSQAELLREDAVRNTSETGQIIEESTATTLATVNEILELARAESGALSVTPMPLNLHENLTRLRPTLQGIADAANVTLTVDVPTGLPDILVDPTRLREILLNLVDNAVKYTQDRGDVVVAAAADTDTVVIEVSDTGLGIPEGVGEQLFEPFYRVEGNTPVRGGRSTGLGLAITQRLVQAHGGHIEYQSRKGKGTTFLVRLPTTSSDRDVPASRGGSTVDGGAAKQP